MRTDSKARKCGRLRMYRRFLAVLFLFHGLYSFGQCQSGQYPSTVMDQSAASRPTFCIDYETGQLGEVGGKCPRGIWNTGLHHFLAPTPYEADNSVFVVNTDSGAVAKISIHDDCSDIDIPQLSYIPGAEEILVDPSRRAVYVAATGLVDLVRLDADSLDGTSFRTGVAATSLTISKDSGKDSGLLLIAGNTGIARMDPHPPYRIVRLRTDGAYGPWLEHTFTGGEASVIARQGMPTVVKVSTSIPVPTISPTQISFKGFPKDEKQTLTITNSSDTEAPLNPPWHDALNGFHANGDCNEIPAHGKCEYVVSPPTVDTADQVGEVEIATWGDPLIAPLCQPRAGTLDAAPAYGGIRCSYDGTCETREFRGQGTNAPTVEISGPDKNYFIGHTDNACGKKPGSHCTLYLNYRPGSPNAVPEAAVTVHTSCPGSIDFTAPVRVVPNYHARPPAKKKKS